MRLKHLEANSLAFVLPHIPSKQSNITHICLEQIWVKIGKISRTFPTHFYSKHFWVKKIRGAKFLSAQGRDPAPH